MSSDQVDELDEAVVGAGRRIADSVEVGAAVVGFLLLVMHGSGFLVDDRVLLLGLATVSSAVGLEQYDRRFRK